MFFNLFAICALISSISTRRLIGVDNNDSWCTRVYNNDEDCVMYGLTEEDLQNRVISTFEVSNVFFLGCYITTLNFFLLKPIHNSVAFRIYRYLAVE